MQRYPEKIALQIRLDDICIPDHGNCQQNDGYDQPQRLGRLPQRVPRTKAVTWGTPCRKRTLFFEFCSSGESNGFGVEF